MPEVLIDILNEDGSKTGETAHIEDIHVNGHWHKSAHLWIFNCKNQILLQRRSPKIVNFPDLWHISVSGHVDSGEDSLFSIIREAKEEIGIDIDKSELIHIKSLKDHNSEAPSGRVNNEFVDVYLLIKNIDLNELKLDLDEVPEVRYVDLNNFEKMVSERNPILTPIWEKFEFIINYLKENKSIIEKTCSGIV